MSERERGRLVDRRQRMMSELAAMDEHVQLERWDLVTVHAGRALALAGVESDPRIRLSAHYQRARALALSGHPAAALLDSRRAAELADELGESQVEAQMWLGAADTHHHERQPAQAVEAYERALQVARWAGDDGPRARATTGLEVARAMVGERDRLVAGLRSRLEQLRAGRPAPVLAPEATAEATALRLVAGGWPPDMEARYVLGTFHWCRWVVLPGEEGAEDLAAAVTLFGPLREAPAGLVPEQVRETLDLFHQWCGRGIDLAEAAEETGDGKALAEAEDLLRKVLSATASDDLSRSERLSNLGIVRLTRFELTGDRQALEESVALSREAVRCAPASDPSRAIPLTNLGNSLEAMHDVTGDAGALAGAVEASREALLSGDPLAPEYAGWLSNLGLALTARHRGVWDLAALDEAIDALRDAALLTRPDDPSLPGTLSNLGNALLARHESAGHVESLREAVDVLRRAVRETAERSRYLPERLGNLGNALQAWHEQADDDRALAEAIEVGRRSRELAPEASPFRATCLSTLSAALRDAWLRYGRLPDLDEAVDLAREAIHAGLAEEARAAGSLMGLALTLKLRFDAVRDLSALDEAIDLQRRAAANPRLPAFQRAGFLSNVGNALRLRSLREEEESALEEAVAAGREAVSLIPEHHPARPGLLSNLALSLQAWHERGRRPEAMAEAIACLRLAVELAPAEHPGRPSFLSNLGGALLSAAEEGQPGLLAEAIEVSRTAVGAARASDPALAAYLERLGEALRAEAARTASEAARREAIRSFGQAAAVDAAPASIRVRAAQAAGQLEAEAGRWTEAAAAYATAVGLLPRVATPRLRPADQQHELSRFPWLVAEATAAALESGDANLAVELLEQGRGILLAQALEPRGDLSELRARAPELHEELLRLREELDADVSPGAALWQADRSRARVDRWVDHRHRRSGRWEDLLARIREVPGLQTFLLPLPRGELLALAGEGPVVLLNVCQHRSDALVLTTGGVEVVRLPALTPRDMAGRAGLFLASLGVWPERLAGPPEGIGGSDRAVASLDDVLAWLWDTIAEPVLGRLFGDGPPLAGPPARLWWCPASLLHFLPLHAAGRHGSAQAGSHRPGATVMDRVVSSYTPTLRALRHARTTGAEQGGERRALVVAVPDAPGADHLSAVAEEASAVVRAFPGAVCVAGPEATRQRVLHELPRASWAHFACHSFSDVMVPASSRLEVHGEAVTVDDVVRLRIEGAELAFLSACRTVAASPVLPDEALHIASAFQVAGYRQVVGTLWRIADRPAALLAGEMYGRLGSPGGRTAAWALHAAVHALRDRYAGRPDVWAAHVHVGA